MDGEGNMYWGSTPRVCRKALSCALGNQDRQSHFPYLTGCFLFLEECGAVKILDRGFSSWTLLTFQGVGPSCVLKDVTQHCWSCRLGTSNTLPSCDNQKASRCCQLSPGKQTLPWVRTKASEGRLLFFTTVISGV